MITINLTGQQKLLIALEKLKKIENIIRLWMDSGEVDEIMNNSFSKNFSSQGRPKWAELSEITKQTRQAKGFGTGPILHQTGNLMDEITSLKGQVTYSFGSVSKEWGINQLRSEERTKFSAHQTGKGRSGQNLPQRKMIGFQPEDSNTLKKSLSNWIFTQIQ